MLADSSTTGRRERVALADLAQPLGHLGQLGRVERLDRQAEDRGRPKVERREDLGRVGVGAALARDRRRLRDRAVDALDEHPRARGRALERDARAADADAQARDGLDLHVLVVGERVRLAEHAHAVADAHLAREDAPEREEALAAGLRVELHDVEHERRGRGAVAREHRLGARRGEVARVAAAATRARARSRGTAPRGSRQRACRRSRSARRGSGA